MTLHVVQFSSGIGSWMAARRVAKRHGTRDLVLLFADTKAEHPDNYRFLRDAARDIGVKPVIVADGRTPQQAMHDVRLIGNSRVAPCSHLLKQKPCRDWLTANTDPDDTVLYVGIDWSETARIPDITRKWAPWPVEYPMCEAPYLDKQQMQYAARIRSIKPPELYAMGFPHANCGGACVRAGQKQWKRLLAADSALFASWERWEQQMRAEVGDHAILRDRRGGTLRPLPLIELRRRIERPDDNAPVDEDDWGGCGCMTAAEEAA